MATLKFINYFIVLSILWFSPGLSSAKSSDQAVDPQVKPNKYKTIRGIPVQGAGSYIGSQGTGDGGGSSSGFGQVGTGDGGGSSSGFGQVGGFGTGSGNRSGSGGQLSKAGGAGAKLGMDEDAKDGGASSKSGDGGGPLSDAGGSGTKKGGRFTEFDKWWPVCVFVDDRLSQSEANTAIKDFVQGMADECQVLVKVFPQTVKAGTWNPESSKDVNDKQRAACNAEEGGLKGASSTSLVKTELTAAEMCQNYVSDGKGGQRLEKVAGCAELGSGTNNSSKDYKDDAGKQDTGGVASGSVAVSIENNGGHSGHVMMHEVFGHSVAGQPNGKHYGHGIGHKGESEDPDHDAHAGNSPDGYISEFCQIVQKKILPNTKRLKYDPAQSTYYFKRPPGLEFDISSQKVWGEDKTPPPPGPMLASTPGPTVIGSPATPYQSGLNDEDSFFKPTSETASTSAGANAVTPQATTEEVATVYHRNNGGGAVSNSPSSSKPPVAIRSVGNDDPFAAAQPRSAPPGSSFEFAGNRTTMVEAEEQKSSTPDYLGSTGRATSASISGSLPGSSSSSRGLSSMGGTSSSSSSSSSATSTTSEAPQSFGGSEQLLMSAGASFSPTGNSSIPSSVAGPTLSNSASSDAGTVLSNESGFFGVSPQMNSGTSSSGSNVFADIGDAHEREEETARRKKKDAESRKRVTPIYGESL